MRKMNAKKYLLSINPITYTVPLLILYTYCIGLHSLHEEVWDPESIEQVSCPLLLFSSVLLQF